ncbi:hypothetical protein TNCV_923431 [Trichonephila clavipes]|nr:hypothetical protein TNCV_923431 [Trichonephila clavipes]
MAVYFWASGLLHSPPSHILKSVMWGLTFVELLSLRCSMQDIGCDDGIREEELKVVFMTWKVFTSLRAMWVLSHWLEVEVNIASGWLPMGDRRLVHVKSVEVRSLHAGITASVFMVHQISYSISKVGKEAIPVMPLREKGRPRNDNSAGFSSRTMFRNQRGGVKLRFGVFISCRSDEESKPRLPDLLVSANHRHAA